MPKRRSDIVKAKSNNLPLSIYKDLIYDMAKSRKAYQKIVEENKKLGIPNIFFPLRQDIPSYAGWKDSFKTVY